MKRYSGLSILCTAILFGSILVSTAVAEMNRVDDKELARTNAPVTRAAIPITAAFNKTGDNPAMLSSQPMSNTAENFGLNLPANSETWTYNISNINPSIWGGSVTGVRSR